MAICCICFELIEEVNINDHIDFDAVKYRLKHSECYDGEYCCDTCRSEWDSDDGDEPRRCHHCNPKVEDKLKYIYDSLE